MRFYQIHYELSGDQYTTYNSSKFRTPQYTIGGNINAGNRFLNLVLEANYRSINVRSFDIADVKKMSYTELFLGLRYFPMRPTIMIGKAAIRLTAGYSYGFDMANWRSLYFGGFIFTPIRDVSGLSVNLVYRPDRLTVKGYLMDPAWALRLGIIIGPSNRGE
jgi:hypothetical protein